MLKDIIYFSFFPLAFAIVCKQCSNTDCFSTSNHSESDSIGPSGIRLLGKVTDPLIFGGGCLFRGQHQHVEFPVSVKSLYLEPPLFCQSFNKCLKSKLLQSNLYNQMCKNKPWRFILECFEKDFPFG